METSTRSPVKIVRIFRRSGELVSPSRKRLGEEEVAAIKKIRLLERQSAVLRCEVNRLNVIVHSKESEKKRGAGVFGWLRFLDLGESDEDQKVREALSAETIV